MKQAIYYSAESPEDFKQLLVIYESLGWNSLNFTIEDLEKMCKQSWYAVYAYDGKKLIGMARVISDGVITGVICGLCVLPEYQSIGIGKELVSRITEHCEQHKVIPQLMCVESLEPYYESLGFKRFAIGMNKHVSR